VAINQADVAMKGNYWNREKNYPEPKLVEFLEDKVKSTRNRIKEATGVNLEPIYYSAGYKDGDQAQNPYNLSKLLFFILQHTKEEKRVAFLPDINRDSDIWRNDDRLEDYRKGIIESMTDSASKGASMGGELLGGIGDFVLGKVGEKIGEAVGNLVGGFIGGAVGAIGGAFKKIFSW
jgi:predicted GTPase